MSHDPEEGVRVSAPAATVFSLSALLLSISMGRKEQLGRSSPQPGHGAPEHAGPHVMDKHCSMAPFLCFMDCFGIFGRRLYNGHLFHWEKCERK